MKVSKNVNGENESEWLISLIYDVRFGSGVAHFLIFSLTNESEVCVRSQQEFTADISSLKIIL